jgi:hypothetical protein
MNRVLTRLIFAAVLAGGVAGCDFEFDDPVITVKVDSEQKISESDGNFNGLLADGTEFGHALAYLGDLEGDGVIDLVAGAPGDNDGGPGRGAAWILFMDTDGTVDMEAKISDTDGDFKGRLDDGDRFGSAVAGIGEFAPGLLAGDGFLDLDNDAIRDLAVGAPGDDDGGSDRGAVWILFLRQDGTVRDEQKISHTEGNFDGRLADGDGFGSAITVLGDLDNDGIPDLAVGAPGDDDGAADAGAVWVLFMNADGTVKSGQKISMDSGRFDGTLAAGDGFGRALANLGDLNGGGVVDLAVGSPGGDEGAIDPGAVWVLFLRPDGAVETEQKIAAAEGGLSAILNGGDGFGTAVANVGDLDGNGITDLAVGAPGNDAGVTDSGAVWLLFMQRDGTVDQLQKISATEGLIDALLNSGDRFGSAVASIGNLDGRRARDLAVGAPNDKTLGIEKGAVWILFMDVAETSTECERNVFFSFFGIGHCN